MEAKTASRTAEYMAFYGAMESAPQSNRLFTDPFAIHFLQPSLRRAVTLSRITYWGAAIAWYAGRRAPGARTSAIARTRLIDDIVSEALREGMPRVVILGAGFDCRIYRLSGMRSVTAFEVDHPATVAAKGSRLRTLIERLPPNVHFVQIDFSRQSLAEVLQLASFGRRYNPDGCCSRRRAALRGELRRSGEAR